MGLGDRFWNDSSTTDALDLVCFHVGMLFLSIS